MVETNCVANGGLFLYAMMCEARFVVTWSRVNFFPERPSGQGSPLVDPEQITVGTFVFFTGFGGE